MTKSIRALRLLPLLLVTPTLISLHGCTDLAESPTSSITPDNFYRNEEEVLGALAGVYSQLRTTLDAYYNVTQVSSDEHIVPTRGTDWYDNGRWLELDRQAWTPTSPTSGNDDMGGAWINLFIGVSRANVVLGALADPALTVPDKEIVQAELRALRAFYYYLLQDLFGGVPIVETTEIAPRAQNTRAEVFAFIESELNAVRTVLPVSWPAASHGRLTRGAADAILAALYINAEVFSGTVTVTGLTRGAPRWQDAIDAADRVINSPAYSLPADWRSSFRADNHTSPDNILVVKQMAQDGLGLNFPMRALHYSQFNPSPWNGFATIAEVYNAFDPDDQRRQIFLVGPQVNPDPSSPTFNQPVTDRAGNPLVFTTTIADVTQATEAEGARIMKWPIDPNHVGPENGNDFAYFRLAEMHLIKAEALNELGNTPAALAIVNMLRARVFDPDEPVAAADQATMRDLIFRERLFELTAEAKRRQDLIRYNNNFTQMTWFNNPAAREPFRMLMPIPQNQIDISKGLLVQNPGY